MQDQATTCQPIIKRAILSQEGLEKTGVNVAHEKIRMDKGGEAKDTLRNEDIGNQETKFEENPSSHEDQTAE